MPHSNAWNESTPAGTDLVSSVDDFIRQMKLDVRERMALEHVWNVDTTSDGKHKAITIAIGNNESAIAVRSAGSVTGSGTTPLVDLSYTWNTTGVVSAVIVDVTNTASGAGSKLLDLRAGGSTKFSVGSAGDVTTNADLLLNVNNTNLYGKTTGAVTTHIIGINSSNAIRIANTGTPVSVGGAITADGNVTISGANGLTLSAGEPAVIWYESDAGVDAKYWRGYSTTEVFRFQTVNDAFTVGTDVFSITRSGTVTFAGNIAVGAGPNATIVASTGSLAMSNASQISWGNNSVIVNRNDGTLGLLKNSQTVGVDLNFSTDGRLTLNTRGGALQSGDLYAAVGNFTGVLGVGGDVAVNTNKFTVVAASGNTSIAGTLSVTGASALASTTITALTVSVSAALPAGSTVDGQAILTAADAGTADDVDVEAPGGGTKTLHFNAFGFYTGTT